MKRLQLLLLTLLAWPIAMLADVSRDSLVSNYGNWVNLTEGYTADKGSDHQKMQVEIDGSTIHLLWGEFTKQKDGTWNIWYRRSTDLGKTWEDARVIAKTRTDQFMNINSGAANKLMAVSNGNVHIALIDWDDNAGDGKSRIIYARSTDGGANFVAEVMGKLKDSYQSYRGSMIACDDKMVVIAAPNNRENRIHYFTSKDGGNSFSEQEQTIDPSGDQPGFFDLQVSNGRWVSMTFGTYWYYNLKYGYLFITTSDGSTMSTQQIAPLHSDGEPYANPSIMKGGNGDSYNYHPQMVIEGNTIHVMYRGNPGGKEDKNDYDHTLYQKSTDFGGTWSDVVDLPESNGGHGMITAKGDNVYILTTRNGLHGIYYSNDGGSTWKFQSQAVFGDDRLNANRSFWLTIDPNDATGKHAYLTGNRYYYAETKDGFKTLSKNFVLGDESWERTYYSNNHALKVLLDKDGLEHWFLQYQHPVNVPTETGFYTDTDHSSRDILYRRNEAEPAPSTKNMALNLVDSLSPTHRVAIPMTPSLNLKEAMTVEFWVKPDVLTGFQLAATTEASGSQEGSIYTGGWCINLDAPTFYGNLEGYQHISAALCTEKATDEIGIWLQDRNKYQIWELNKWHHIALTYDSKVIENNAHLYVDGMLIATGTGYGNILQGNNPIVLGRKSYDKSEGLLDNFMIWSRALTQEEIRDHIYNTPDGQDNDCRLLLTFDGTLKDQSQYGNDALGLLDVELTEHDGIRVPHPSFVTAKDLTGKEVTVSDASQDCEAVWWLLPRKGDSSLEISQQSTNKMEFYDAWGESFSGTYTVWMAAAGTGDYNAYATTSQTFEITGLNKVEPTVAGKSESVGIRIYGGYKLNRNNKPAVKLRQGETIIEGTWAINDNYDSSNIESGDDLAPAVFNLAEAALGKYDVIVDNDTLFNAFELEAPAEMPAVWAQVNGGDRMLAGKWKDFSIDFGNTSNVPAYNTPFYLLVPTNNDHVDVSFDFDISSYSPILDDTGKAIAEQMDDYLLTADENGNPVRCYALMIPYIAPNSTNHKTFRIKFTPDPNDETLSNVVGIYSMIDEPWGPDVPDAPNGTRGTRALASVDQMECMAQKFGQMMLEDGVVGQIPFVGCAWTACKTVVYGVGEIAYAGSEDGWSNFGKNTVSSLLSCGADLTGVGALGKLCFFMGSMAWSAVNAYWSREECMSGDGNKKEVTAVRSYDPNEMIGPSGYDDNAHYIKPIHNMAYTITYENKSSATAPAHEVYVNDKLDLSKYDAESFGFTSFGWADTTIVVGGSYTKDFTRDIKYKVNDQDIIVRVSGAFNQETGIANWSMISLTTGGKEIDDPDLGYLLPNNDDHVGEGFVTFSINHKPNPANGSTISNKATIVFDANPPIETNTFVNTFDTDYPTSKITKSEVSGGNLVLTFEGKDATSGVASYDLFVFKDGGEAEPLAYGVTENQYSLPYADGTKYAFCVIATDHVGWKEAKDVKAEYTHGVQTVTITMGASGKTTYCGNKSLDFSYSDEIKAYTATGYDAGSGTIWLTRVKDVPAGTPILVKGTANKPYDVPITDSNNSYYENMFVGNTSGETIKVNETEGDLVNYYLSGKDGTFKSVNKSVNIGPNKSYLQLPGKFEASVTGNTEKVKMGATGKTSFAAPVDLDFSDVEGLKAFSATGYDRNGTIWLTRVMKVQKGEGLLLKGDASKEYEIPSTAVQSGYVNMFVGNVSGDKIQVGEKSDDSYWTYYYLSGKDGTFKSVNKSVNIGDKKCYLKLPTSMLSSAAGTRGIEDLFNMDEPEVIAIPVVIRRLDSATGIDVQSSIFRSASPLGSSKNDQSKDAYYNLQGQRIDNPGKGLYIKNGRMVIIR